MITSEEIENILKQAIPDSSIEVIDLTGGEDHWEVRISSALFKGLCLIEQHQMVQNPLLSRIDDGSLHALSIKTKVKE